MMQTIEYKIIDKSSWGEGPWQNEIDKMQWKDEATGLPCLIVRNPGGALCGYVGVDSSHSMFQKEYDDVPVDVHGGLTFASSCHHGDETKTVCHIPGEGETDNVWWFGFDCAHSGDKSPKTDALLKDSRFTSDSEWWLEYKRQEVYRTVDYVKQEIKGLAQQLAGM